MPYNETAARDGKCATLVTFAGRTLRRIPGDRVAIGTDRSDMLTVTAPADATDASLKRAIGRHYPAIARWVTEESAIDACSPAAKELVPGEGFLLDGRCARYRHSGEQPAGTAQFERDGFGWWLRANIGDDPETVLRAITACYGPLARERVRKAAEQFAPRFGLRQAIDARAHDRERDWVSTRLAKGVLRVEAHWALAQFSRPSVDYLVARALAGRTDARCSLEAVVPCPWEPRRRFHREAPDIWTGAPA